MAGLVFELNSIEGFYIKLKLKESGSDTNPLQPELGLGYRNKAIHFSKKLDARIRTFSNSDGKRKQ